MAPESYWSRIGRRAVRRRAFVLAAGGGAILRALNPQNPARSGLDMIDEAQVQTVADKNYNLGGLPSPHVYTFVSPRIRNYQKSGGYYGLGTESYSKLWIAQ
jgi:hypothetical protein